MDTRPTMEISDVDLAVIKQIQREANARFDKDLFLTEEDIDPVMKTLEAYLYPEAYPETKHIKRDPSKREKYQNLYELLKHQGKKVATQTQVVNTDVAKEKEAWIVYKIKEAQKEGRLSVPDVRRINEKMEDGDKIIRVQEVEEE